MPNEIIFLFYSASGTAGIETNSQFPVESDGTDAETNDESGNSTELHHPPESEAPQKIEGKMCVYDYLYDLHGDSSAYPMCSAIRQYSYLIIKQIEFKGLYTCICLCTIILVTCI